MIIDITREDINNDLRKLYVWQDNDGNKLATYNSFEKKILKELSPLLNSNIHDVEFFEGLFDAIAEDMRIWTNPLEQENELLAYTAHSDFAIEVFEFLKEIISEAKGGYFKLEEFYRHDAIDDMWRMYDMKINKYLIFSYELSDLYFSIPNEPISTFNILGQTQKCVEEVFCLQYSKYISRDLIGEYLMNEFFQYLDFEFLEKNLDKMYERISSTKSKYLGFEFMTNREDGEVDIVFIGGKIAGQISYEKMLELITFHNFKLAYHPNTLKLKKYYPNYINE